MEMDSDDGSYAEFHYGSDHGFTRRELFSQAPTQEELDSLRTQIAERTEAVAAKRKLGKLGPTVPLTVKSVSALSGLVSKANVDTAERCLELEAEVAQLKASSAGQDTTNASKDETIRRLQEDLNGLNLTSEMQAKDEVIAQLRENEREHHNKLSTSGLKVEALEARCRTLQADLDSKQVKVDESIADANRVIERHQDLLLRLADKEREIALNNGVYAQKDRQISEKESQISAKDEALTVLRRRVATMESEEARSWSDLQSLQEELHRARATIKTKDVDIQGLQSNAESLASLREELDGAHATVEAKDVEIRGLQSNADSLASLREELDGAHAMTQANAESLASLREELDRAHATIKAKDVEIRDLQSNAVSLASLRKELAGAHAMIRTKDVEIRALESTAEANERALQTLREAEGRLQARHQAVSSENESLRKEPKLPGTGTHWWRVFQSSSSKDYKSEAEMLRSEVEKLRQDDREAKAILEADRKDGKEVIRMYQLVIEKLDAENASLKAKLRDKA